MRLNSILARIAILALLLVLGGCAQQDAASNQSGVAAPDESTSSGSSETTTPDTDPESNPYSDDLLPPATTDTIVRDPLPAEAWISAEDLQERLSSGEYLTFDTRTYVVYTTGTVPEAKSLPLRFLSRRYAEIPRDTDVFFIVINDKDAAEAYAVLLELGFAPENLHFLEGGGVRAWAEAGFSLEKNIETGC